MDNARATSDLISHLPGDVTENILLRLPLKEAVKTSLLSNRWRYKWITIPQLVFDSTTFSFILLTRSEVLAIIHQILFQHEGPISKFLLSVPRLESCPELDHLISFLSRKGIEEFTLRILQGNAHKIPSYLFSCLQMRLLCLHQCVLKPPPDFAGFAKLTGVNFSRVDLPARFAQTFVAKCPLLECLTLHNCTNLDGIDFYAPNLKLLDYLGRISFVSFRKTPSLKKVSIEHESFQGLVYDFEVFMDNTWITTFCSLPSLEYLKLGPDFSLMLAAGRLGSARRILGSKLNCLVILVLSGLPLGVQETAILAFFLIIRSPNLQKLEIKLSGHLLNESAIQFSEVRDTDFSLEKLQAVEMSSFKGLRSEMEFIELLLAKSPVLETMHIYHLIGRSTDQKFSALLKTNQLPRASPRAKVTFLEPDKI